MGLILIDVDDDVHDELKILAIRKGLTLKDFASGFVNDSVNDYVKKLMVKK